MASYDNKVKDIETKYGVKAINSEERALFYFFDDDKKGIGIMTFHNGEKTCVLLSKKQAKAVINEFADICEMIFD